MVGNKHVPSFHPNSENESSENIQIGFTGLGDSPDVGGPSSGYTTSHTNNDLENNNNKLLATRPATQTLSEGKEPVLPNQPSEELAPHTSKRPRGRPLGSKNKKKESYLVGESDIMKEITMIGISDGTDIVESLLYLAQRYNTNITVFGGSGHVSDVTLLDQVSRAPAFPMKGTFRMLSLEGTYHNPNCGYLPPEFITNPSCSSFSIHLGGSEGKVFCGTIGGKVKAEGQVIITAILSKKHMFYQMNPINRNIEEVVEDHRRNVSGVIGNHDRVVVESNTVDNGVAGSNSSPKSRQPPPQTE